MKRIRIDIISVLGLLVMIFLCTSVSAKVLDKKLLTSKIGWMATENNLFWTINAGVTWQNITPQSASKGNIAAVFFLNTSQGWVVCCDTNGKHYRFNVATTNDGGAHWSISPLKTPASILTEENRLDTIVKKHPGDLQFQHPAMGGTGWIDFMNPDYGWMILGYYDTTRPTDTHTGIMLETTDGGKAWKQVGNDLPTAGDFYFVTTKDGWLTSHVGSGFLYVTHNGGDTWQKVTLPPPPPLSEEDGWYDLPIFKDSQNGFMPVTYETENLPSLVLFATHDGGKTWKADRVLPNMKDIANVYPSTVTDSILITIAVSKSERSLTLIEVFPGGKTVETKANALHIKGDMHSFSLSKWWKLNFITGNQGWVSNFDQLLSTTDGGATWTVITP